KRLRIGGDDEAIGVHWLPERRIDCTMPHQASNSQGCLLGRPPEWELIATRRSVTCVTDIPCRVITRRWGRLGSKPRGLDQVLDLGVQVVLCIVTLFGIEPHLNHFCFWNGQLYSTRLRTVHR